MKKTKIAIRIIAEMANGLERICSGLNRPDEYARFTLQEVKKIDGSMYGGVSFIELAKRLTEEIKDKERCIHGKFAGFICIDCRGEKE